MPPPPMLPRFVKGLGARVANAVKANIIDRALPDSKGGETPKQLQTYRTEIHSYFTVSSTETQLLYSAENWVRIKLALQTAGPVAVGTSADIVPVLSGRGILLDTDIPFEAYLAKGTRFYVTSETVNRLNVTIEPVPWLEQIDQNGNDNRAGIVQAIRGIGQNIVEAITALRTGVAPPAGPKAIAAPTPMRLPPSASAPRLTPPTMPRKLR